MTAGKPDWARLNAIGRLPDSARARVPMLAQIDASNARLESIKAGMCEDCRGKFFPEAGAEVQEPCEAHGCKFVAKAATKGAMQKSMREHVTAIHAVAGIRANNA